MKAHKSSTKKHWHAKGLEKRNCFNNQTKNLETQTELKHETKSSNPEKEREAMRQLFAGLLLLLVSARCKDIY